MMKSVALSRYITVVAIAGVLVSTYALYVEMAAEAHPGYKALCDIAEYASCSRVLTSEYSKGFGVMPKESSLEVPNCIYGILFYCIMILLATFDQKFIVRLQFYLAIASVASSVYLAYLLAFVLRDFCIVCVSTYFINAALVGLVYKKDRLLTEKSK
ncbi:vitamin K epoxide reductase complex subunit 1-like protein 1 isoform X2 [Amyelois transitella]|nr:vitamin K epoxide reductase complex subunit 1-like protein 1 isoform X2 [Amyelois transitella]XP_013186885.1 vitamin K epoxide reductase complex subunit 1-like protein 1 isoform X2 [Amyelois transitella]XP_013186886.1 vitamin K epoxide reductase complex subunit 1-like protein 1 isoform X2 [Amyelois transitella]